LFHDHFFGIHDSHTGSVVAEYIMLIHVIIGEHEVQTIPDIFLTSVIPDGGGGYKFKIDAIAVTGDPVMINQGIPAFPQMNTITRQLFGAGGSGDEIVPDSYKGRIGNMDGKIGLINLVVVNQQGPAVYNFNGCKIIQGRITGIAEQEIPDCDMITADHQNFIFVFTIQNHSSNTLKGNGFCKYYSSFFVYTWLQVQGVAGS